MAEDNSLQKIVEALVRRLVSEYKPERVILYGSHAWGVPTRDSDIDLLIIKDTGGSFVDRWVEVRRILSGTHPSVPLDTLVITRSELKRELEKGNQFLREIVERGKVLYAAD